MGASDRAPGRTRAGASLSDPSLVRFRSILQSGLTALERRRREINDIDVLAVADGDTGDNMVLTLRSVLAELDRLADVSEGRTIDEIGRDEIVASVARAALLGARGTSGVILSQLIRGAAEELASRPGELIDPALIGAALARAADQAYGSVRDPAEGTMLTVAREMAHRVASELAHRPDARLSPDTTALQQDIVIADLIRSVLAAGEDSVARSPDRLRALRDAGVVDAGGYGLVVLVGGIVAGLQGGETPPPPEIEPRWAAGGAGRSRPGLAAATVQRSGLVAVVDGEGLRELFADLGAVVLGSQAARAGGVGDAIAGVQADEVVVLPNGETALAAAHDAAASAAPRPVVVVATGSPQAGLAAAAALTPAATAADAAIAMSAAADHVRTGSVAPARADDPGGRWRAGDALGLIDDEPAAWGEPAHALREVLTRLGSGAEVITCLTGAAPPLTDGAVRALAQDAAGGVPVTQSTGGQPDAWWLLSAQ